MSGQQVVVTPAATREETCTILSGAATPATAVDTAGWHVVYIRTQNNLAGTAMTFTGAGEKAGTFLTIQDETNTDVSLTKVANTAEHLGVPAAKSQFFPRFIKPVSSGNAGSDSVVTIGLRPY